MVLSLISLAIAGILWRERNRLLGKWKKATATIIENVYCRNDLALFNVNNPDDDETATYYPVIRFTTAKNETITRQLDIGGYPPRPIGTKIVVIYDTNDPNNFMTNPQIILDIMPKLLTAIGLIGLIVTICEYLVLCR